MKTTFTTTLLCILLSIPLFSQNYTIDAGHSTVQIQIERFGVVDVVGRFKAVEGSFTYHPDAISNSSAEATIRVDSYDANNAGGEAAVKSKAFLDAATYPEITFKSKKVVVENNKNYLIGDLAIHGVTKEIKLPFTIKGPLLDPPTRKQSIAFNAAITINRHDYGITFDKKLPSGAAIIGNEVKITLVILAIAQ